MALSATTATTAGVLSKISRTVSKKVTCSVAFRTVSSIRSEKDSKTEFGSEFSMKEATSRDRPKSAPCPRLKNSKKTSKCQVFSFTVLENRKFFEKITYSKKWTEWLAERGTLPKLSTFLSQLRGFCRKT